MATSSAASQPSFALQRERGIALWRQIEAELEGYITAGRYAEGRLPTEQELARRFGVNRHTIRQALQGLRERGVVDTRQGRGSFLRTGSIEYALGLRTRFSHNLAQQNVSGRLIMLAQEVVKAGSEIARPLKVRAGTRVERIETLGLADRLPISASTHYFPHRRFHGIGDVLASTGSITLALAKFDVADYVRASTQITAELPDAATADRLQSGRAQPVLLVRSVNVDAAGRPIQYSETKFCADRVRLVVQNDAPVASPDSLLKKA